MTLTNHLLTGAVLAKILPLPIAIPLAFASHFILDALPHFGFVDYQAQLKHKKLFGAVVLLDVLVGTALSLWLVRGGHLVWLLVGLVAYAPDLIWIYRFTVEEKFGKVTPTEGNWFVRFHTNIQKYERMWGGIVEVLYGTAIFLVVR